MIDPAREEARATVEGHAPGVTPEFGAGAVPALTRAAERLDALADTAELMGDDAGSARLRAEAQTRRLQAMDLLDG